MNFLTLKPLTAELLLDAIALDQQCFGGLWTLEGYQRELDSPYSDLLVLQREGGEGEGKRGEEEGKKRGKEEEGKEKGELSTQDLKLNTQNSPPSHSPTLLLPHPSTSSPLLGLGCLWAILEEAHITILAVHPDYHRQGLGQLLLYSLLVAAWQRRLEWVTLEVRTSNQAAIALYQKFGFETVGQRRNYYPSTGEDALILWRSGIQKPEFRENLCVRYQEVCDRLERSGWHLSNDGKNSNFLKLPLDAGSLS